MSSPSRRLSAVFPLVSALRAVAPARAEQHQKLDCNGVGRTSDVISAIEVAVANRRGLSPLSIDIINLSLGHPIFEAAAADVIRVASAGNFGMNPETGEIGYAGTTSPGNAPSAITVGAYDHNADIGVGSSNALISGRASSQPKGVTDAGTTWALSVPLCQNVQTSVTETARTCFTSIGGQLFAWARNIVWGDNDNIVWGNTVYYNLPTWNLLRQLGPDGTLVGVNIVWGDNIVWADGARWVGDLVQPLDHIVWGDNIV